MNLVFSIVFRVDFPALDNLVLYLQNQQQAKIDAMAAAVKDLTAQLQKSGASLEGSLPA
jgi:hypothetical protein